MVNTKGIGGKKEQQNDLYEDAPFQTVYSYVDLTPGCIPVHDTVSSDKEIGSG